MQLVNKITFVTVLGLMGLVITGCAPSLSPDVYTTSGVGQVNRVVKGVIVSSRPVQISDDANAGDGGATGTLAGAALGGIAGNQLAGGSGAGGAAGAIGGAVIGGMVGNMAQKQVTKQTGIEYVIKQPNGELISVVQGPEVVFARGQHVLVQYGRRARVIADPAYVR